MLTVFLYPILGTAIGVMLYVNYDLIGKLFYKPVAPTGLDYIALSSPIFGAFFGFYFGKMIHISGVNSLSIFEMPYVLILVLLIVSVVSMLLLQILIVNKKAKQRDQHEQIIKPIVAQLQGSVWIKNTSKIVPTNIGGLINNSTVKISFLSAAGSTCPLFGNRNYQIEYDNGQVKSHCWTLQEQTDFSKDLTLEMFDTQFSAFYEILEVTDALLVLKHGGLIFEFERLEN